MSDRPRASIRLRDLERCFEGVVPATVATCSPEGVPNVTYLSIVHRVDDEHLALSFQFFNKTRENVLAQAKAQFLVVDPVTTTQYRVDVRFVRSESEGPVFERMRANLDAVASQTGMSEIFRLRGADVYRVVAIEELAHDLDLDPAEPPTDFVAALETLCARLAACDELDALLETTLAGLAELFDHRHATIFFSDGGGARLYVVASHGFAESGVGAEVAFGHGPIGTAAQGRRAVRISNLRKELRMAEAVLATARDQGHRLGDEREIPLPGLSTTGCQLAVPILARDRTLGVLSVQSADPGRFTIGDEQALGTLARYLATALQLLGQTAAAEAPGGRAYATQPRDEATPTKIRYHASDDSIFVDGEYLIKGLPGRILHRLLVVHERDGRVDFTNKELRVDETLRLGGYRDNLEARLILLRTRLEERSSSLRLARTGRGRFRLEVLRPLELEHAP